MQVAFMAELADEAGSDAIVASLSELSLGAKIRIPAGRTDPGVFSLLGIKLSLGRMGRRDLTAGAHLPENPATG